MPKKISDDGTTAVSPSLNKDTKRLGPVSKQKYEVHYHDWQRDEIDNLLEMVSIVPSDLGHKARWRWIAKAMTTERVFTYHDCHHAYKMHQNHLEDLKRKEKERVERIREEKEQAERREQEKQLKQEEWAGLYSKRCVSWIKNEDDFCGYLQSCSSGDELLELLNKLISDKDNHNNPMYQVCPYRWIQILERKHGDKIIQWSKELSIALGKCLHYFDNFYFDGYADNKLDECAKNAREILCDTWNYESSASLYRQTVVPLAKDLFGDHFDNVGMAQALLNLSRVQLELVKESTYDEAFSPSRIYRRNMKGALENAFSAHQLFERLATDAFKKTTNDDKSVQAYKQSIYFWYIFSFHMYCRALYCSGYTTGLGAWHTSRKIQRTHATDAIDVSAKMVVSSFIEKAVEDKQVKEYKKLRNIEKKRLESLSVDGLDKKIEVLRKEYRAIKKTIKKVGARAQKKCDELAHLVKETQEDKKVVVALNRKDQNNFAKQDAKRIMKKRIDVTVGIRVPPELRDVKKEMMAKELKISEGAKKMREEVDDAFTPRASDFKLAEEQFRKCLHLYGSEEIHVSKIDGFKVVMEKELGDTDDMDRYASGENRCSPVLKEYDDMYFTNYHKALLHADIGRMNFYVAVVAEAEGLSITGITTEPAYCYKVAIANYEKAMRLFCSNGYSSCPVYAIMCEDLAEVYSRRKEWGDQSEAFALCTKAAVVWDELEEHAKKNHVMEQAKLYSMYNIDDDAVKAYLKFQNKMRKLKIQDLEGPEERRRRIKLGLDRNE